MPVAVSASSRAAARRLSRTSLLTLRPRFGSTSSSAVRYALIAQPL